MSTKTMPVAEDASDDDSLSITLSRDEWRELINALKGYSNCLRNIKGTIDHNEALAECNLAINRAVYLGNVLSEELTNV